MREGEAERLSHDYDLDCTDARTVTASATPAALTRGDGAAHALILCYVPAALDAVGTAVSVGPGPNPSVAPLAVLSPGLPTLVLRLADYGPIICEPMRAVANVASAFVSARYIRRTRKRS